MIHSVLFIFASLLVAFAFIARAMSVFSRQPGDAGTGLVGAMAGKSENELRWRCLTSFAVGAVSIVAAMVLAAIYRRFA